MIVYCRDQELASKHVGYTPIDAMVGEMDWLTEFQFLKEESMTNKRDSQSRDNSCSTKAAERGQLTFTLVEQDRSAAPVICEWIKQNIMTAPAEKLHAALDSALICRDFPNKKDAD